MNIEFSDFLNVFDIFCIIILFFSALFSLKGGILKSLLNLIKWLLIILALKYSFNYLRVPFTNALDLPPTIIDILIFVSVLIVGFVILSLINKLILGILNAEKVGPINRLFGFIFGIIRGYILIIIIFSVLINWNISKDILNSYDGSSVLFQVVESGNKIFKIIPKELDEKIDSI